MSFDDVGLYVGVIVFVLILVAGFKYTSNRGGKGGSGGSGNNGGSASN